MGGGVAPLTSRSMVLVRSLKEPEPVYLEYSDEPFETANVPTSPVRRSSEDNLSIMCILTRAQELKCVCDALNSPVWLVPWKLRLTHFVITTYGS